MHFPCGSHARSYAKGGDRRNTRPKRATMAGATKKAVPGKKAGAGGKKSMPSSPSARADPANGATLTTKIRVPCVRAMRLWLSRVGRAHST